VGSAIALRGDFDGPGLRRLAKAAKDAGQSRRCLALAEIYDGGARWDAARLSGVGLQVIRDWVLRFNADGPDGLIDRKASGPAPKLDDAQRQALARVVENGPIPATPPGDPWCGALAPQGPGTMGIGGIPHLAGRDDREPGAEGTGVRQDFGTPASHCAKRIGRKTNWAQNELGAKRIGHRDF
jgi:hypothetical protein